MKPALRGAVDPAGPMRTAGAGLLTRPVRCVSARLPRVSPGGAVAFGTTYRISSPSLSSWAEAIVAKARVLGPTNVSAMALARDASLPRGSDSCEDSVPVSSTDLSGMAALPISCRNSRPLS
jgi:hypothetical protein